jgi:phosphoribosyl-ATP pyrophosphohydrolase/phosphoribosyl-AMP cyclohydrolase
MKPNFDKQALVPAIVQDEKSGQILMQGYMNEEAFNATLKGDKICFFSRSKNRLWIKGETSGNYLYYSKYYLDCDQDSLLFMARAEGPTCHTGSISCFDNDSSDFNFLTKLENRIEERRQSDNEDSYVSKMSKKGVHKVAQKVGEEAVEMVIEALRTDDKLFLEESADLLFHYLFLLQEKGFKLKDVEKVLEGRMK